MRVKWNRNLDGMPTTGDTNDAIEARSEVSEINNIAATDSMTTNKTNSDHQHHTRMAVKKKCDAFLEDDKRFNKLTTLLNIFKINNNAAKSVRRFDNDSPTATYTLPRSAATKPKTCEYSNHLFTTDSKRRRRANNLLLRNSAIRRSWHQLCTQNNHKSPMMVSSTPSTPLFYRNGKSPSIRSSSPSDSYLRTMQTNDELDSVTMQHDSVDSAVELDSHISDDGSFSMQQCSNVSQQSNNSFNVRSDNSIEVIRENDAVKFDGKLAPKTNDTKLQATTTATIAALSESVIANGSALPVAAHNNTNNLITYQNEISFNVLLDENCEKELLRSEEMKNDECGVSLRKTPLDASPTRTESAITSNFNSTSTAGSYSRSSALSEEDALSSRFKEFHSQRNDAIQFSDNNEANHSFDAFIAHKEDERQVSAEPSTADDIVKVTVKKALIPEIVNISQKNGETSITPIVKFEGDEPVAVGYTTRDKERDKDALLSQQQQQSIQGILKDRSNGSVVGTTVKSAIPKKVHFAETTRLRTKTAFIANHAKNGGKPSNATVTTTSSTCSSLDSGVTTITTTSTVELKKTANTNELQDKEAVTPTSTASMENNNETSLALTSAMESKPLPLKQQNAVGKSSSDDGTNGSMPPPKLPIMNAKTAIPKSKSFLPKTPLPSPSTSKPPPGSVVRSNTTTTVSSQRVGTASARAATTLLSMQKEMEKCKKLNDAQKKQLFVAKKEMVRSSVIVQGLACVVRYLNEDMPIQITSNVGKELLVKQNTIDNLLQVKSELEDEIKRCNVELEREKARQTKEKDQLLEMFEREKESLENKFSISIQTELQKKSELQRRIAELKHELDEKTRDLGECKKRITEIEATLAGDKDRRVRALNDKIKYLSEEVKSLKAVLEIKEEDVKNLSFKLRVQEQRNEEMPTLQQTVIVLNQKLEQLEISMNQKIEQIARLTRENEGLKNKFETEAKLRRRISMKNEELEFALSESMCGSLDSTPFKPSHKPGVRSVESTPIRSMSRSYHEHWNNDFESPVLRSNKRLRSFEKIEESGMSNDSSSSSSSFSKTVLSVVEFDDDSSKSEKFVKEEKRQSKSAKSMSRLPKCILDSGFEEINGLTNNK